MLEFKIEIREKINAIEKKLNRDRSGQTRETNLVL